MGRPPPDALSIGPMSQMVIATVRQCPRYVLLARNFARAESFDGPRGRRTGHRPWSIEGGRGSAALLCRATERLSDLVFHHMLQTNRTPSR